MRNFLQVLNETFRERVWFVGLQGSYGRGEATETSDIDIVVILDRLSAADIQKYNTMLDTLSNRELICGFLSGIDNTLLQAIHVQDGNYKEDCHIIPYLGSFNWNAIMQSLKQIDYKGELTFEIVKYLKNIPDELLLDSLIFAEKVGRHLISIFKNGMGV